MTELVIEYGDTDLVYIEFGVDVRRFGVNLTTAHVQVTLVGDDGAEVWHDPTTDTMLNSIVRELTLRVGPLGSFNPPRGIYRPKIRATLNGLDMRFESRYPDTVTIQ